MTFRFADPMRLMTLPPPATASILSCFPRLQAVHGTMSLHADTREGAACVSAVERIEACVQLARKIEPAARTIFNSYKGPDGKLQYMTQAARDAVPKDVGILPIDRQNAVQTAEVKAMTDAASDAFARAQKQHQEEADRLASSASAAMREVREAILAAEAATAGPLAFRERLTLDDIAMIASVREGEAKTRSPSELARTYEGLVVAGNAKREQLYANAIETELKAIVAMAPPRLRERLGASGPDSAERRDLLEAERKAAAKLLERIAARAEDRTPESLRLARFAAEELRACFICVLGQHPLSMSRAEYSAYRDSPRRDPMKVSDGWPTRLALATWDGR